MQKMIPKFVVHILVILTAFIAYFPLSAEAKKTVCLNMIVKDEKDVITRCLSSVKPIIDYWVIVDTGSTDGTQEIIKEYMKDVPGELYERPWVNFAHNRNEALQLTKGKADYVLIMDADDVLQIDPDFQLPQLTKDAYWLNIKFADIEYARPHIVNNQLNWKWEGVLHEALGYSGPRTDETLQGINIIIHSDGARSKDPEKYWKDAKILEEDLLRDPDNSRSVFYLARTYSILDENESALKMFIQRVGMGGWDQEVYSSLLDIAHMQEKLNYPHDEILKSYYNAYFYRPARPEALYHIAKMYRESGNHAAGLEVARCWLNMPRSTDILFVQQWMGDYGILLEYSICAYWLGRYDEALLASNLLLQNKDLPDNYRDCVLRNRKFIYDRLNEENRFFKLYSLYAPLRQSSFGSEDENMTDGDSEELQAAG